MLVMLSTIGVGGGGGGGGAGGGGGGGGARAVSGWVDLKCANCA